MRRSSRDHHGVPHCCQELLLAVGVKKKRLLSSNPLLSAASHSDR